MNYGLTGCLVSDCHTLNLVSLGKPDEKSHNSASSLQSVLVSIILNCIVYGIWSLLGHLHLRVELLDQVLLELRDPDSSNFLAAFRVNFTPQNSLYCLSI